jgi:hypothetical protein
MLSTRPLPTAVIGLMALVSVTAFAQTDLLANGSFEAGLTGWSQSTQVGGTNTGTCSSYTAVAAPGAGFPATNGNQIALNTVTSGTGGGIVSCVLYQDVAIPAGVHDR